jgi:hypothetical protein
MDPVISAVGCDTSRRSVPSVSISKMFPARTLRDFGKHLDFFGSVVGASLVREHGGEFSQHFGDSCVMSQIHCISKGPVCGWWKANFFGTQLPHHKEPFPKLWGAIISGV